MTCLCLQIYLSYCYYLLSILSILSHAFHGTFQLELWKKWKLTPHNMFSNSHKKKTYNSMWKSYCYCIFCSRERTAEYSLRLLSARKTAFLKKLIPSTQEKRLSFVQVFIIFSKKETLFSFLEKACREIRCPKPEDLKLLKTFIWNQVTWKVSVVTSV